MELNRNTDLYKMQIESMTSKTRKTVNINYSLKTLIENKLHGFLIFVPYTVTK